MGKHWEQSSQVKGNKDIGFGIWYLNNKDLVSERKKEKKNTISRSKIHTFLDGNIRRKASSHAKFKAHALLSCYLQQQQHANIFKMTLKHLSPSNSFILCH